MINQFVSGDCYGCASCVLECSHNAITMKKNEEGFWYPSVDRDKCIDCRQCLAVCPVLNADYQRKLPLTGYAFIGNEDLRAKSSSGGAFGAIAEKVLFKGGYVCGAAFANDYKSVQHILSNNIRDLQKIQKSKYLQSQTGHIYRDIKDLLDKRKTVFFCGTPCQVAGLNSYLRKEYDNLITADLLCRGTPSEYAWEKFIEEKGEVSEADFRDKTQFYPYAMRLRVNGEDTYELQKNCDFMQGFLAGLLCRDCCGNCPFRYLNRTGDVTLADFWGVEEVLPQLDHTRGCSAVLVNTEKGKSIAETYLKESAVTMLEVCPKDITTRNGALEHHSIHPGKKIFFQKLQEGLTFSESYQKACEVPYDFGLIGFWYIRNYGAALTAYALERAVKKEGYSVLMIDAPESIYAHDSAVYDTSSPTRRFISQFCSVSGRQESQYDLQKLNDLCDGFLVGSDQLWRWKKGRHHQQGGAYYLLDFVNADKKKVAYGTSFGETEFTGDNEDRNAFRFLMGRFSDVLVRERDAVALCKESFGCDATWVVDPVFLLGIEEYICVERRSILDESVSDEDYIFIYLLHPTKEKNRVIRQIVAKLGKRVIAVSDLDPNYVKFNLCDKWEFEHYTELEVADWIKLIRHAAYVITDSYHGFCFSIIFRKEFIALTPRDGLNRFQTIAKITGLENRIDICGSNVIEFKDIKPIDYHVVWERLQKDVDRSRVLLQNALKKEIKASSHEWVYDMIRYNHLRYEQQLLEHKRQLLDYKRQLLDYKRQLLADRDQYWALSSTLRRKSFIERKYIIRTYLVQKLAGRHIAIRGAGVHTTELLKLLDSTDLSILCIWDRELSGQFLGGHPVINDVRELKKYGVDTVLLSSYKYRGEMAEDARKQLEENGMDIDIMDFYEQLQNEGIPIDSEFYWYDWELPT